MNLNNQVWEIMTTNLTFVEPGMSVYDLKGLFIGRAIHHLPVVDKEGKLLGIISSEDMKRIYEFMPSPAALQAQYIMTVNPTHIAPDTPIREAAEIFLDNRFRALPVVDKKGVLVGLVSSYDVMKLLYNNALEAEKE